MNMKISKRWIPALVAPAVVGAVSAFPMQASAVDLPDLSPTELMVMMQGAKPVEFTGVVLKTTNLGLPALELSSMLSEEEVERMREKTPEEFADFVPEVVASEGLAQAMELITGEHRVRIFVGETGMRAQILDRMSQRDLIVNQEAVWTYDSREQVATYASIDQSMVEQGKLSAMQQMEKYAAEIGIDITNPQAVADYVMSQIGDSSEVTVGVDHYKAGRTAYELIVKPNSSVSLVDSVVLSIDSETAVPLAATVYSVEQTEPAIQVGFESISFADQDENLFTFTAPAGTEVTNLDEMQVPEYEAPEKEPIEGEKPQVVGEDWESVVVMPAGDASVLAEIQDNQLLTSLLKPVAGGVAFETPLVKVLITNDGRIFAGAVTLSHLQKLAN
jgi:outer membrane lipoprotein-sorting protein